VTGIIVTIMPYIHRFGYWAVAGTILPEGFGVPLPGETTLIGACLLASRGDMAVAPVLVAAFLAAIAGNTIGYGLGYYGGRPLVLNWGRYVFITEARLVGIERFFSRYGRVIILIARFLDVFRQLNGIAAGVTRMPFLRFQIYNTLGAILWVGFWGGLAYGLGHSVKDAHQVFTHLRYGFFAALILALIVAVARRAKRR
jgi:membrane protein DedA with SNARE-associated domain